MIIDYKVIIKNIIPIKGNEYIKFGSLDNYIVYTEDEIEYGIVKF